jgi:DeoR family transcriptional regulator, fructose operon transcriptional repressor
MRAMSSSLPEERRLEIIQEVRARPLVRATELAERFNVSVETIRRDLVALERDGLTRRVYGGVTAAAPRISEPPFEHRRAESAGRKAAMARLAATLIDDGDLLVLDIGTSVAAIASALPLTYRGRVLTNSLLVAMALADRPDVEVLTSGGRTRGGDLACYGAHAERFFADFHGGKAFLGTGAIHPTIGLTDYYPDEIPMRRIIIERASERWAMADSSKLDQVALATVCSLASLTGIITDDDADQRIVESLEQTGTRVLIASVPA